MSSTTDEFLANNRGDFAPAFKFDEVGKACAGTLTAEPRKVEGTDLDGKPQTNWVFEITTDDGDRWSLWAPQGKAIGRAIAEAVKASGATQIKEGDRLGVVHTGVGEPTKPGFSPPKQYSAQFKPAQPAVAVDSLV